MVTSIISFSVKHLKPSCSGTGCRRGNPVRTHFVPLHESAMGSRFVRRGNRFIHEEGLGSRLVRLPLHPGLSPADHQLIMDAVTCFFRRLR